MTTSFSGTTRLLTCAGLGFALFAAASVGMQGQGGRGGRGGVAPSVFALADADKDGCVARAELKATFDKWFASADKATAGSITQDQLLAGLNAALPPPATGDTPQPGAGFGGGRGGAQNQTPIPCDVDKMMAALPDKAPAEPAKPRKVLVLAKAAGFVHSSIPLAAKTVEAIGTKTGAWSTTITYDPADINAQNLQQYDLVFLDSTTGQFLDDPNDAAATAARRQALMNFVRSGKGLAGIHAASDSYHASANAVAGGGAAGGTGSAVRGLNLPAAPAAAPANPAPAPPTTAEVLAPILMKEADKNNDAKLSKAEFSALADAWFDKMDTDKSGKLRQSEFSQRFAALLPPPPPGDAARRGGGGGRAAGAPNPAAAAAAAGGGRGGQVGTWPEFNKMIGGFFKWHWVDPQLITVKIDDPKSPLTAMFKGREFEIHDETYTFAQDSFSRDNVHVLTSIDYAKMTDEDKAKEPAFDKRTDGDYGLSWIRREGNGRVFYEAHGHSERIYAMRPMLEHILAGMQYAIGDLKADDTPRK